MNRDQLGRGTGPHFLFTGTKRALICAQRAQRRANFGSYVHFGQMLSVIFQSGQILRSNYGGQKWSNLPPE